MDIIKNEQKIKKILKTSFVSTLAITTIGFTIFGIGAGGRATGVSQIEISDTMKADSTVKAEAEKANQLLSKFPTNTGFLKTKGEQLDSTLKAASQELNNIYKQADGKDKVPTTIAQQELYSSLKSKLVTIGDVDKYNKEVADNKTFFNVGVVIFSLGLTALISVISYWIYFRWVFSKKDK